jgi:poly-gamma-glutamate biosynthesis protein PgsC/CapC
MITIDLNPQTAALSLGVGLVFSLLCYLTTNLSPGGMITPGWLAIAMVQDYLQVVVIVAMTIVTYLAMTVLLKITILYGKRLFAAIVLLGVLLQLSLTVIIQGELPLLFVHQTLGFVAPGLIVYQLIRQPPAATMLATGIVSAATYGVMISGILAGVVPAL